MKRLLVFLLMLFSFTAYAEDGYLVWAKGDGRFSTNYLYVMPNEGTATIFDVGNCANSPRFMLDVNQVKLVKNAEQYQCGEYHGTTPVSYPSGATLVSLLKFEDTVTGEYNYFTVPALTEAMHQKGDCLYAKGVVNDGELFTYLALYNLSDKLSFVTVTIYDDEGTVVGEEVVDVLPSTLTFYGLKTEIEVGSLKLEEGLRVGGPSDIDAMIVGFVSVGPHGKGSPRIVTLAGE